MASNYKIFFISIYLASASVIAQHFSVGEMYYYRIPDSKLYRAQMNVTNEWLSAEIIIASGSNPKYDKRKIVFFKHGDPSDLYIELSKKKAKKVENYVYDGRLLMWSSDSSKTKRNMFSFIHYNAKKDVYQFVLGFFDDDPKKLHFYDLQISGMVAKRVVDYSRMSYNNEDYFISVIADYNNDKSIHFLGEGIFGTTEVSISNLSKIATEIEIHNSRKVLLTVRDEIDYSDVYYFRDLFQVNNEDPIKIFMKDSWAGHQMNPSFNSTGDFIAFIDATEQGKSLPPLMRLYLCPIPIFVSNQGVFNEPRTEDYILVDDNLRTVEHMELPSEMAMEYSWHPQWNTLFYVKKEKRVGSLGAEDRNIWYYNLSTGVRKRLETNTTWNYSISFSPDGKYILFSTLGQEYGNNHFSNCSYKDSPNNSQCCSDGHSRIICVAELIRNE